MERHLVLMGTTLDLRVEAADRAGALRASEAAVRALEEAEARLSTWRDDSELARLNLAPVGHPVALSAPLAFELAEARRFWELTGGAFDPSVGALVQAWGLRSGGRVPAPAERAAALRTCGLDGLDVRGRVAVRLREGLILEEGAFGKGAGLDAAMRALADAGATRAVLDLGGQVAVLGPGPFSAGIADPRDRGRLALRADLDSGSLATSGNSEHGFTLPGARYGHILDPRRGEPAPDFGSVTVWAPSALAADCLATGLFVLGPDAALERAALCGCEVVVLETWGDGLRARSTAGLGARLTPLAGVVALEVAPDRSRGKAGFQPE